MNKRDVNESQMNGTQDDILADGTPANGSGSDHENLRCLSLLGFLRELVRAEGRMEAAALLGVNYKTLVRAEESGKITWRMGDALERLLDKGDDPEVARLRGVVEELESRMAALEGGAGQQRVMGAESEHGCAKVGDGGAGQPKAQDEAGPGRSETWTGPPIVGLRPQKRGRFGRLDPEVVTEEPAEDDHEVYGTAWPLVEEWRGLRAGHPYQGKSLSWLTTQERLLVLELEMLEEHGLTLPPETQALRGFGRRGQTSWRWKALADTRRALRKRDLLRWVRRVLTLGLWRK